MNDKFIGLDRSVSNAESRFKGELDSAIARGKALKREVMQKIRNKHLISKPNTTSLLPKLSTAA